MTDNSMNRRMIKTVLRALTPPIIGQLVCRATRRKWPPAPAVIGREQAVEFYDVGYAAAEEYHRHYADTSYYSIWCVLVERIHPANVQFVFDIGCGPGQFAAFLRDKGLRKYVGLDFSNECIRMARLACPEYEFVCADALTSPLFDTLPYDVVVSTEFLEHVEGDLTVLKRIRPGTHVFCTVPNFPHIAHVRHFKSANEVRERYAEFFSDFFVDEFLFGSTGMRFFLFEGVRASAG